MTRDGSLVDTLTVILYELSTALLLPTLILLLAFMAVALFMLGGLARVANSRNRSGLPILREIPVLGVLFGRRARDRDSEELIVLVTPYLLQ